MGETPTSAPIVIARRIAAPPDRVFDAWLNSKQMETWMAPARMGATAIVSVQPRVNGRFRIDMIGPDKQVSEHVGAYLEIDRPRRLVFTWNSEEAAHHETVVQVDIDPALDGGSELRLSHAGLPSEGIALEHERRWRELLDQLAILLTER